MESVDSSPNYMRARSRFDANKENSPGGSECDEIMSVSSSTGGSTVNGPYTRKFSNNGIKYRTSNKKTLKNFGSVRSFRKRAKPRVLQSPVPISDEEESLVASSQASPHYLKATTSSQGKKMRSQASPLHSESTFDGSEKSTSHSSQPNLALSRTSSLRNVRILIKRTSFKPKRSLLRYSKASEDIGVERATYSSTLKDSKFPVPVELHPGGEEPEKSSAMKVCRYHHCSLHGHCHGSDDPAPPLKRFLYKRRQSLKKQKSAMPKTELNPRGKQSSDRKKNLHKSQLVPEVEVEPLNQERFNDSITVSGDEHKNGVDSHEENYPNEETQLLGDGCKDFQESYLVELAFGETSFPERSYQDNQNIMRKYSLEDQDFGRNGYCSTCSCHGEEVATNPRRAKADLTARELTSSSLDGNNNVIPQNGPTVDSDTSLLASFKKPKEAVDIYIEDVAVSCGDEVAGKDGPDSPVVFDETERGSAFSSASYNSQTSTDSNSEEDAESTTESLTAGDSKVNEVARVEDSETNTPTHNGGMLHFSKPGHMSMWNLIHQHMSSNLSVIESTNKPVQEADGESPVDGSISALAKDSTDLSRESSDSGIGTVTNDSEAQEIELRKLFAVKLVREAIEKILLPEVQDQASDDQSIASESTPRAELMEITQSKAFTQENDAESDANKVNGNVSSAKEGTVVAGDASSGEIREAEKQVVRKSEKKAPKHWSNLKKWILLQRFIRELEKVRKFNPRKPQHLLLNPDPEAEKVNLRPQTLDGRKSAEEWMLDHALQQAVSQLAPTQKRKVALLVRAFETVVPPQEDSQVQFRDPRLRNSSLAAMLARDNQAVISDSTSKEMSAQMVKETEEAYEDKGDCESSLKFQGSTDARNGNIKLEDPDHENGEPISKARSLSRDVDGMLVPAETSPSPAFLPEATKAGNAMEDVTETEAMPAEQGLENEISDTTEGEAKDGSQSNQMDRRNHIKMWHMIYQHVVSGIAEKVGLELLEGGEDDEAEDNMSSATSNGDHAIPSDLSQTSDELREETHVASNLRSGLTKSDALKLVKEAVDEILLPEIQDDASDTQSVTSEPVPDQDIPERNVKEGALISKRSDLSKSKNWSKLKKLMLLKRSIKALEKARDFRPQPHQLLPQIPDPEPEKVDLRQQMMDERKKAEQWMLDYAVQHIVTKLTPARKRRVFMLVEAFEAVVPFPEI